MGPAVVVGRVEPTENVEEGALAGARRAENRDPLAVAHRERGIPQHRDINAPEAVGLLDVLSVEKNGRFGDGGKVVHS